MKPESSPESAGQSILERLGIAEDPLVGVDPVSFLRSLAAAGIALVKDPGAAAGVAAANARLAARAPDRCLRRLATNGSPTRHTPTILCTSCWPRNTC